MFDRLIGVIASSNLKIVTEWSYSGWPDGLTDILFLVGYSPSVCVCVCV